VFDPGDVLHGGRDHGFERVFDGFLRFEPAGDLPQRLREIRGQWSPGYWIHDELLC
jgi:hypothetical protein